MELTSKTKKNEETIYFHWTYAYKFEKGLISILALLQKVSLILTLVS